MLKKYITLLLTILGYCTATAQENAQQINTALPEVIKPSPTVAALMKFEEVPVDNYTGIPNISIPLCNVSSASPDINIGLSLQYHPGSIIDKSAWTGLGWSLMTGGTISRTVRGMPDEKWRLGGESDRRMGIYSNFNNYYNFIDNNLNAQEYNRFLWDCQERGMYDTEHDLYQFNFMGNSGRFIIKKIGDGILQIQKLDDYIVKIDMNYTYNAAGIDKKYTVNSFTIYDDKGYRYVFDVQEITEGGGSTSNEYILGTIGNEINTSFQEGFNYISAYQLSAVYGPGNELLVSYVYNKDSEIIPENNNSSSETLSYLTNFNLSDEIDNIYARGGGSSECKKIDPVRTASISTVSVRTKKIKKIDVKNKAKIYFDFEAGREDDNATSGYKLKMVTLKTWADSIPVKKFTLNYGYTTHNVNGQSIKKLILTSVNEGNFENSEQLTHNLYYKDETTAQTVLKKDYWGYFTVQPAVYTGGAYKEPSALYCTTDVLQKIVYPTGGSAIFDFESNTYSYIGNTEVTDFTLNPDNWAITNTAFFVQSSQAFNLQASTNERRLSFTYVPGAPPNNYGLLFTKANGTAVTQQDGKYILEPGVAYRFMLSWFSAQPGVLKVNAVIWEKSPSTVSPNQFLYGGGVRIKRIGYFKDDQDQNYYDNNLGASTGIQPDKEKNYNYNFFNNSLKSSGSLVFGKPVFTYFINKTVHFQVTEDGLSIVYDWTRDYQFRKTTTFNSLSALNTKGGDVGYKNVKVYETNNGRAEYEYKSPIDVPQDNEAYNAGYPFLATRNLDYKRGLITKETTYDKDSKLLNETLYDYTYSEYQVQTGLQIFTHNTCPYIYKFQNFENYYSQVLACQAGELLPVHCIKICDIPVNYIATSLGYEAYGWSKLSQKTMRSYFYGTTTQLVETKEYFTYNPGNKKLDEHTVETYGTGTIETKKSKYTYFTDPSAATNNRISDIKKVETSVNGTVTDAKQLNYSSTLGYSGSKPMNVQAAKGTQPFESRAEFLSYDTFGNPLEVKQTGGPTISYIWGYNKSEPIAKVENATYAQIATALGISVATLKNYSEANIATLNNLRTLLPAAMVTTYTYVPLVGVSTITNPAGDKITYEYDAFGRLKVVKDNFGKTLSENEYNYRP